MQERSPRPAHELTEDDIYFEPEVKGPPLHTYQYYLGFFRSQPRRLVTLEEIEKFHQSLPRSKSSSFDAINTALTTLRTKGLPELPEKLRVITVGSSKERMHGAFLIKEEEIEEITSLSDIGVSVFSDEPEEEKKVVTGLSDLPKEKLLKNTQVKFDKVVALFEAFGDYNEKTHILTPFLTPTQRRLLAILAEYPQGVSSKTLIDQGLDIRLFGQSELELLARHLSECRAKISSRYELGIYRLPGRPPKESKYILTDRKEVGEKIRIPVLVGEELSSIPELPRIVVNSLLNYHTVHSKTRLRNPLYTSPAQRWLLLYLGRHFGAPCSLSRLTLDVFLHGRVSLSYTKLKACKNLLQETLEGSELVVFTLYGSGYILDYRDRFQGKKKEEVSIVHAEELTEVDEEILLLVQRMGNLVRINGTSLRRVLGRSWSGFLALAEKFPNGLDRQTLSKELFSDCKHPDKVLADSMDRLMGKLEEEFPGRELSLVNEVDQYRLEVAKEK